MIKQQVLIFSENSKASTGEFPDENKIFHIISHAQERAIACAIKIGVSNSSNCNPDASSCRVPKMTKLVDTVEELSNVDIDYDSQ